jgi:hypothetical protein
VEALAMNLPPIPVGVYQRWELAMQGYRYDVASGSWRRGGVALSDEAIDGPDEALWALLMGLMEP